MLIRDNAHWDGLQNKIFVFDLREYALVFLEAGKKSIILLIN